MEPGTTPARGEAARNSLPAFFVTHFSCAASSGVRGYGPDAQRALPVKLTLEINSLTRRLNL
jgi:hypothetical protein